MLYWHANFFKLIYQHSGLFIGIYRAKKTVAEKATKNKIHVKLYFVVEWLKKRREGRIVTSEKSRVVAMNGGTVGFLSASSVQLVFSFFFLPNFLLVYTSLSSERKAASM